MNVIVTSSLSWYIDYPLFLEKINHFKDRKMNDIFSCTRCGFCCHGETTVSLDDVDQARMLSFLKITRAEALATYWNCNGGVVQMKVRNGHCIFFNGGCTVHKARPWRCRQWPMVPAILHDSTNLQVIQDSCPGLKKSVTYEAVCARVRKEQPDDETKKSA